MLMYSVFNCRLGKVHMQLLKDSKFFSCCLVTGNVREKANYQNKRWRTVKLLSNSPLAMAGAKNVQYFKSWTSSFIIIIPVYGCM